MAKIGIITLMPNFLRTLIPALQSAGHEVLTYQHHPDRFKDSWNLKEVCDWADILFCEFCQHPMDIVTQMVDKPIIARLWRCEIYNGKYLNEISWDKVDHLFIATSNMHDKFQVLRQNKLKPKKTTVFDGPSIDLDKFSYVERNYSPDRVKLALVGNVLRRKGAHEAVRLLSEIPAGITLTLAGAIKDKEYAEQIKDLAQILDVSNRVQILGEIPHETMPEFMQRHDVILGMSIEETAHYAMAEGMATGCYPLMLQWKDCDKIYPEYSYKKTSGGILLGLKEWVSKSEEEKQSIAKKQRKWAEAYFDKSSESEAVLSAINELL